jgi:hypothetical protein
MRPPDNNYGDILHPETDSAMVLMPTGEILDDTLKPLQAAGTATALAFTVPGLTSYTDMKMFWIMPVADNGSAATTLNFNGLGAKPLYKEKTTTAPVLTAWKLVQVWYSTTSNCFFLKASGSGTAVAADLLAGKTATADIGDIVGTIPVNADQTGILNITGSAKPTKAIPVGYVPAGTITAQLDPSLAPSILETAIIGGVQGTAKGMPVIAAGTFVVGTANTERSTVSTTPVKLKEITVLRSGTVTVTYEFRMVTSGQYVVVDLKRGNGEQLAHDAYPYMTGEYGYRTIDIPVTYGDKLQLWVNTTNASAPAYVRSFHICMANDLTTVNLD